MNRGATSDLRWLADNVLVRLLKTCSSNTTCSHVQQVRSKDLNHIKALSLSMDYQGFQCYMLECHQWIVIVARGRRAHGSETLSIEAAKREQPTFQVTARHTLKPCLECRGGGETASSRLVIRSRLLGSDQSLISNLIAGRKAPSPKPLATQGTRGKDHRSAVCAWLHSASDRQLGLDSLHVANRS